MKTNPFYKFLKKEDHLHIQVITYIKYQHPKILTVHIPNEGRRTKFERYKAKLLGITSGMPDLMIFKRKGKYVGCAIELKILPNRPTKNQLECLEKLSLEGWLCNICYDFSTTKKILDDYLQ